MNKTTWNLDDLYSSQEAATKALEDAKAKAKRFEALVKGNLKNSCEAGFVESIRAYESIMEQLGKIMTYAYLRFAKDASEGGLLAKFQQAVNDIYESLLFFELEFNRLSKAQQTNLIQSSGKYQYYLKCLQDAKPHQLSYKEERILLKKSITSGSAFSRLFDEHFSRMYFVIDGKKVSEEVVLSMLHSPDREVRKKAAKSLTKGLKPHQPLLAYIFNQIKQDHKIENSLRKYKTPEASRHLENKITQKSVDALIDTTESHFGLVHRYYEYKKEQLGLDVLYDYDRYAPLSEREEDYTYEQACQIVLRAFDDFCPSFGEIARKAFEDGWVDVYPKEGKRSGAFSHPATPDTHPYVLLNFTNKRRDVFTLAHELGHAIHQYLARDVGYLLSDTPLTTAETASVFAEMLVFDAMLKTADSKSKKAMLASKIEDIFATLYRQINFTTFERLVHAHDGELSTEEFNEYWMQESKKMFGSSVKLTNDYKLWWSYIPHFIHSPFYCYAYSYGQLLVLALYGLYKSGTCKDFTGKYQEFLRAGGSKSPKELVGLFGFDIEDKSFWEIGIAEVRRLVETLEGEAYAAKLS